MVYIFRQIPINIILLRIQNTTTLMMILEMRLERYCVYDKVNGVPTQGMNLPLVLYCLVIYTLMKRRSASKTVIYRAFEKRTK